MKKVRDSKVRIFSRDVNLADMHERGASCNLGLTWSLEDGELERTSGGPRARGTFFLDSNLDF
jgi:hypothetical protein